MPVIKTGAARRNKSALARGQRRQRAADAAEKVLRPDIDTCRL